MNTRTQPLPLKLRRKVNLCELWLLRYTIESTSMRMLYFFFAVVPCSMTPSATSRIDLRRSIAVI
jgi:hypothetical protein